MTRRLQVALCLAGCLAASPSSAEVRLTRSAEGRLTASSLPPILALEEVAKHLRSGLTTTFLLRAAGVPAEQAIARVRIRYELWDELFLVAVVDGAGTTRQLRLPSPEALEEWWKALEIDLLGPGGDRTLPATVRVTLDLIPFSEIEQDDAQRWLAESIGRSTNGPRGGGDSPATRAIGALIATSIRRRAAESWSWRVAIESERADLQEVP